MAKFKDEKSIEEKETSKSSPRKNGKSKFRGRKRNNNTKRDDNHVSVDSQPHIRGTNDYNWYAYNEQLLRDTSTISFNYPTGYNISDALVDGWRQNTVGQPSIPGVMSINLIPTYGISYNTSSALNVAARQVYNFVRSKNSGSANYDAPDYMMYFLAVDSIYSFYAFCVRAYGILSHYTFFDKYSPDAIIRSMCLDADSLRRNFSQFRSFINLFAAKIGTFLVPKDFYMFMRHVRMYGNIYKDADTDRAQLIMYNPECFYKYNPIGSETGATLDPILMRTMTPYANTVMSFDDLVNIGNELLAAADDQDFIIMAGDTLKAFGEERLWKQGDIDDAFKLEPIFDFTWLMQIQNAMSLDLIPPLNEVTDIPYKLEHIIPENGRSPYLKATCEFTDAARGWSTYMKHKALLTSPFENPTPGDVIESTRLTYTYDVVRNSDDNTDTVKLTSCGSEIVSNIQIMYYNTIPTTGAQNLSAEYIPTHILCGERISFTNVNIVQLLLRASLTDMFNMHPTQYVIRTYNAADPAAGLQASDNGMMLPRTDLENWAVLDENTIKRQHDLALLSMLYVRGVGIVDPLS